MSDGNGGANYAITFVNDITGEITARAITVTATTDTKVYDATTSSSAIPTITSGTLAGTDSGSFTQTFDTAAAGTGKTLTPAGSVIDGNAGCELRGHVRVGRHRCDHRSCHHGDGDDRHQGLRRHHQFGGDPDHHSGTLASGDTAAFTQTFGNANVGTGKTLTPAGVVNDGNGGASYTVTFVSVDTGEITARAITVTATTDTKGYDATTASAAIPTITVGTLAGTDTAAFTQTFGNANVGTAKTLTPAGSVIDGNAGANYAITFVNDTHR